MNMQWMKFVLCGGLGVVLAGVVATTAVAYQWSGETNISNTSDYFNGNSGWDFDADGYIHVAWHDFKDSSRRIYYATNRGGSWQASRISGNSDGAVSLNITQQDQTLYISHVGTDRRTYVMSKPVSGGSWSSDQRIDTDSASGFHTWSEVNGNDELMVLWLKLDWDSQHHLYARSKPYGGSFGDVVDLYSGTGDHFPTVDWVGANDNKFYAGYSVNGMSGAWMRIRSTDGTWGSPVQVMGNGGAMTLSWSPVSDEMAATWSQPDDRCGLDWRVYVKYSTDDGQSWYGQKVLSDICWLSRGPAATYDANGNLHVIWQDITGDGDNGNMIYRGRFGGVSYRADDGGSWCYEQKLTDSNDRNSAGLNGILYHGDRIHVLYNDNRNYGYEDIFYRHKDQSPLPTWTVTRTPTVTATFTHTNTPRGTPADTNTPGATSTPDPSNTPSRTPTPDSAGGGSLLFW